jgi:predicted NAD-dependent protein-ADP-ribosyltransferase YbiA (DUF1768 family)
MRTTESRRWPDQEIINAGSYSGGLRESELSNFSPRPFVLRGQAFANAEAFVQALKYPERSPERDLIAALPANKAKRRSPHEPPEIIEWEGRAIPYRSHEHYQLQAAGIFAKFDQNPDALYLLLATGKLPIIHDLSRPDRPWQERPATCLPAAVFSRILMETRQYFFRESGATDPCLIGTEPPEFVSDSLVAYVRSTDM